MVCPILATCELADGLLDREDVVVGTLSVGELVVVVDALLVKEFVAEGLDCDPPRLANMPMIMRAMTLPRIQSHM